MGIREDEILEIFETYGRVVDVKIHDKEGNGGTRSCFVVYREAYGAQTARKLLHDVYKFRVGRGEPITVDYARPRGGAARRVEGSRTPERPRSSAHDDRGSDARGRDPRGRSPDR